LNEWGGTADAGRAHSVPVSDDPVFVNAADVDPDHTGPPCLSDKSCGILQNSNPKPVDFMRREILSDATGQATIAPTEFFSQNIELDEGVGTHYC
jgi:hypothetical protein